MKFYIHRMRGGAKSPPRKPLSKIGWSWLGAFLGIYAIALLGGYLQLAGYDQMFLIGSFGASAVLIYGAPIAEFSQPRNLVGGHLVSALVGVSLYKLLPEAPALGSALAVSLSVVAMHFTKTIHPPGGASALIAVLGGTQVHELGYWYVLSPVGVGVVVMLLVALIVNNLSVNPKRHYPTFWW